MKRCHDCGNTHENEHGWCELCHLPPRHPPLPDDIITEDDDDDSEYGKSV